MLFIKISGVTLIVFAGFLGGRHMSQNLKKRCETLEQIITAARFFKEQMVCFRYEVDIIYKNLLISGFKDSLLRELKNTDNFSEYLKDFDCLTQRDKKLTYEFFSNLGMSDIRAEEERALVYIKLISDELNSATEEYLKKAKLYKNVGTFLGIGLAIFLI